MASRGECDLVKEAFTGSLSISRALSILELLADEDDGLSLSAVARALELNKQIATRLITVLETTNYIYKEATTGKYQLSHKLSNLGLRRLMQSGILDPASSVIRDLANETGELVRLALVENDRLTWVLAAVGKQRTLHIDPNYSLEIRLHSTATGKAWLSTLPIEWAIELMQRAGIVALTKFTITDLETLKAELKTARRAGWAISVEETELGVGAVAAPILVRGLDTTERCVGTISVAAPVSRMARNDLEKAAPLVISATRRLADMWPKLSSTPLALTGTHFRLGRG